LAKKYPRQGGVLLAFQRSWTLPELISLLDRLLSETKADEWIGEVRWLNDWRGRTATRG